MKTPVDRTTVDLSGHPDLVVIYLGMRVRTWRGLRTLFGLGPQILQAGKARPEGLLHFENNIVYSLFPMHLGMRWYWRDFECLERWARSDAHRAWWTAYLRDSGGTGFWHETYFMRGGMEAVYDDIDQPTGLHAFAPVVAARGPMFSARGRAGPAHSAPAQPGAPEGATEGELY